MCGSGVMERGGVDTCWGAAGRSAAPECVAVFYDRAKSFTERWLPDIR